MTYSNAEKHDIFQENVRLLCIGVSHVFLVLYVLGTIVTLMQVPRATANFERFPWAALIVVVNLLAMANIPRAIYRECPFQAFLSSVVTIVALVSLLGLALWPNLATASNDRANSLTIYRAASSAKTLGTMLIIAVIGMPFVIGYTAAVYWTFRGEVKVDGF
ncbi:MAG: cytochrome d ubiquinol oxidase subunit II [Deltaproteobacteria bacterium]|nr:cytochrome d ubiquinol oxidase subunit II [Deltaproteobacteria bacterium]